MVWYPDRMPETEDAKMTNRNNRHLQAKLQ